MKSKKLLKKGGNPIENIFKQNDIVIIASTNLYDEILNKLNTPAKEEEGDSDKVESNNKVIIGFLSTLNDINPNGTDNLFKDIVNIIVRNQKFQAKIPGKSQTLFTYYSLYTMENAQKFITIDPTIIQIMIFDPDIKNTSDIVYSLKLILREKNNLTIRYTTELFPKLSKINFNGDLENLENFNQFNLSLDKNYFTDSKTNYNKQLEDFLKKYIKYYEFYKKCYTFKINEEGDEKPKTLIEYDLRYISILGKARFGDSIIQARTALVSDYIMANLLFASPTYAFISGGYKGFKDNKYGVTRSGYEIAKKYNRPILTIMCKEGLHDSHDYSDSTLIYGEHWGEDSIALSQFTDGAIIIAPFGGWTYIECLTLLKNEKIVGIYNDLYNILSYNETRNDDFNFFKFFSSEQNSIINYYINYYLILIKLYYEKSGDEKSDDIKCLSYAIKILKYLQKLLPRATDKYRPIIEIEDEIQNLLNETNTDYELEYLSDIFEADKLDEIEKYTELNNIDDFDLEELKKYLQKKTSKDINRIENLKKFNTLNQKKNNTITSFKEDSKVKIILKIIPIFNQLKKNIESNVNSNLETLNEKYKQIIGKQSYQNNIPQNCDGIWIKPKFDIIKDCITNSAGDAATIDILLAAQLAELDANYDKFLTQKNEEQNKSIKAAKLMAIERRKMIRNKKNNKRKLQINYEAYEEPYKEPTIPLDLSEPPVLERYGSTVSSSPSLSSLNGGSRKKNNRKRGGACDDITDQEILREINTYNINYENIKIHDIFNDLNNNIIFVFSDIMYLNIYLNKNLKTDYFQTNLQNKITKLSDVVLQNRYQSAMPKSGKKSQRELLKDDTSKNLSLDKRIDGYFDINHNKIRLEHIIKKNYTFIIDEYCSDYSTLIK
jgi:hypothetical protein